MSRLLVLQQSKSFRFFVCVLAALTIGAFFADTAAAPSEAIAAEANAAAGDAAPAGEGEIQVEPPPTVEQLENHWHTNGEQGSLYIAHLLSTAFSAYVIPEWLLTLGGLLITVGMVFGFINLFALGAVWSERKVSAHMQCRLGPMEVGPHGLLQTIADGIKLTTKEDIIPKLADRPLFIIAPIIVFTGVLIRFVPLPFGDKLIASDMDLGLFFIAAVGAVEVLGVIMAGWSSNNKWSLFATIRTATQMVSYEIPIGIAFITVIVSCGSFSLVEIVNQQGGYQTTVEGIQETGWIWHWNLFRNPFILVLSITYFIASLAECKRAPFDLPEAESELVSGFHTEYSGIRFALFFLAEYAAMYLVAAIGVVIFFGEKSLARRSRRGSGTFAWRVPFEGIRPGLRPDVDSLDPTARTSRPDDVLVLEGPHADFDRLSHRLRRLGADVARQHVLRLRYRGRDGSLETDRSRRIVQDGSLKTYVRLQTRDVKWVVGSQTYSAWASRSASAWPSR